MRAERLLPCEPQHRRAQRREDARHGRPCRAGAVGAHEEVVVHGVEERAHRGDGPPVRVTPGVDLPRVADAEAEEVPVVEGVREDARGVRRRHRVARPDVRDARGDLQPVGRREEHRRVGERLPRAEPLGVPERVVAERLDLAGRRPGLGSGRDRERAAPDADRAEPHAGTVVGSRRPGVRSRVPSPGRAP